MNKPLSGMTNKELWKLFPILLVEYTKTWCTDFDQEKNALEKAIGINNIIQIHHIGSTAVPGLLAKPTIDILLEIPEKSDRISLISKLESIGYIYSAQPHKPDPGMMFMKGYTPAGFQPPVIHVHIRYPGDWDEIYFRDYLRTHPGTAQEYAALKIRLKEKFMHHRDAYTAAKTEFIQRITGLAREETSRKRIEEGVEIVDIGDSAI